MKYIVSVIFPHNITIFLLKYDFILKIYSTLIFHLDFIKILQFKKKKKLIVFSNSHCCLKEGKNNLGLIYNSYIWGLLQ